jgi:hypothetical protein
VNLVRYWEWLHKPGSLNIAEYGSPVVRGLLNFHGQSFYARVSYGNRVFRVLCNSRCGLLEVSVAEIDDFAGVSPNDLKVHLHDRLQSVASQRNSILCAAD